MLLLLSFHALLSRRRRLQQQLHVMVWAWIMIVGIHVHGFVPVHAPTRPTTIVFLPSSSRISSTTLLDTIQSQQLPRILPLRQTSRDHSNSSHRPTHPESSSTTLQQQSKRLSSRRDSPSTTTTTRTKTSVWRPKSFFAIVNAWKDRILESLQRPGTKFRLAVAVGTAAAWYVASTFLPPSRHPSIVLSHWISQRGFQGLSAFGRSIAYVWALFVAYPKWLDKKAVEQQQETLATKLESKKKFLKNLAQEAVLLRSHIHGLDSEIRSFRRDVLTLRAQGYVDPEIQDAIADEMAYLVQLKQDTQQALMTVKQAWSDARSRNPLTWDEDEYDTTTTTFTSALTAASSSFNTGTGASLLSSSTLLSRSQPMQKQTMAIPVAVPVAAPSE
jgi:hypothetical protein